MYDGDCAGDKEDWVFDVWSFSIEGCYDMSAGIWSSIELVNLTLFTKSDLPELGCPIAPNIVTDTSSDDNRDDDSEEDSHAGGAVFLVELLLMTWAWMSLTLVKLYAIHASCHGYSAIAGRCVVLLTVLLNLADQRVIWR